MFSYKKFLLKNTLIICVIFSVLFTASFYFFEYSSSKTLYVNSASTFIKELESAMDESVVQAQNLSIIFHSNNDFKDYIQSPEPTSYMRRLVAKYLFSTVNAMPGIGGNIAVINPSDSYIVSGTAIASYEYFASMYNISYSDLRNVAAETNKNIIPEPVVFFSEKNDSYYYTVIVRDISSFSRPYIIIAVYSFDKFTKNIPQDTVLLINSEGRPVYLSDNQIKTELKNAASGQVPFSYSVLYNKTKPASAAGPLNFMLVMKKTKYFSFVNNYISYTIPFGILFFILSYIFANYTANKSHKPIKKILDQIENISPAARNDEIEHISSAISLLVNRNKNLSEAANANNSALKEKFINDLMQNRLTSEQTSYGIKTFLDNSGSSSPMLLIIIGVDRSGEHDAENTVDTYSYYDILRTLSEQTFGESNFLHFTTIIPSVYCAIVSSYDIIKSKQLLQNMLFSAENDIGISLKATMSEQFGDWHELPAVFASAYLTHTTVTSSTEHVAIIDNSEIDITFFYSSDIDEKIYKYCISGDNEGLEKTTSALISKNFPNDDMFVKNKDPLALLIYALCTRITTTLSIETNDIFTDGYNVYLELKTCKTKDDFLKKTFYIFQRIINYNIHSKSSYEQIYSDKMLGFIHDNYQKNISLADIAEHMNMSQAYVSRLFKKLVKCNFKDYLVKIRLDNAKRLLAEHPNMSVSDIALEIGFNTARTFTNTFSAAFGMTPTEYRHLHLK